VWFDYARLEEGALRDLRDEGFTQETEHAAIEFNRACTLYEKHLAFDLANSPAWIKFAELESQLQDFECTVLSSSLAYCSRPYPCPSSFGKPPTSRSRRASARLRGRCMKGLWRSAATSRFGSRMRCLGGADPSVAGRKRGRGRGSWGRGRGPEDCSWVECLIEGAQRLGGVDYLARGVKNYYSLEITMY